MATFEGITFSLDRCTSGLMILAKSSNAATLIQKLFNDGKIRKTYLAKVTHIPIQFDSEQIVSVDKRVAVISYKHALCRIINEDLSERGKSAVTLFEVFDREKRILSCKPISGRMHQIRLHLQYLGCPIVDDNVYNNVRIWKSDFSQKDEEVIANLVEERKRLILEATLLNQEGKTELAVDAAHFDETCKECKYPSADPRRSQMSICLHSYELEVDGEKYVSDLPQWALRFCSYTQD
ncbi:hypothetical protein ACOME3_006019 [Neoechinorhynchus agilis]